MNVTGNRAFTFVFFTFMRIYKYNISQNLLQTSKVGETTNRITPGQIFVCCTALINIVNVSSDPWLMMVEYAVDGSLYQYLQLRRPGDLRVHINSDTRKSVSMKNNKVTAHKLLCLAAQVVNGLQHINRYKVSRMVGLEHRMVP